MPSAPPRHCQTCGTKFSGRGYHCSTCKAKAVNARAIQRGTTTERGLGWSHRKLAAKVITPDSVCWLCGGEPVPGDSLTLDHVIPRSHGGVTELSNLRPAHRSCNSRRQSAL